MYITESYLQANPTHIFVFGDNKLRAGYAGAAKLRGFENSYGFITKKYPCNRDVCFYETYEYMSVYEREIQKLIDEIESNQQNTYLISKIGSGLANRFGIFENVIEPNIKDDLSDYSNVVFLW